jgi:quercetin dioxygenase-like cupin family protein
MEKWRRSGLPPLLRAKAPLIESASVARIEQREIRVLTVGWSRISFHSIRATLAGLKNPQTAFTENSMKLAVHLVTVAALAILSLAAARPARAQQGAIHPPELDMPDATHGKTGITHKSLLKSDVPGNSGQEVIVWDTEYAPRAINPRHYHPAAITFYVVSGTGIWQEDGKAPLTLKAGDSLFVPAGTTHAHWNPSYTESLRFLEFIAGARDKVRPEPQPHSN